MHLDGQLEKSKVVPETRHRAIAQDTIEKKVLKWPKARWVAFAEKLIASVEDFATPEIGCSFGGNPRSLIAIVPGLQDISELPRPESFG